MGQIHGASELCDLFSLPRQLSLNLCAARQLRVQSFAHVVELIFNHGENIGPCHRWTGRPSCSRWSRGPAFSSCATLLDVASLRRHLSNFIACCAERHG